jgi:hypothetical protein
MPFKRGAPAGNVNRLKHGRYRATALLQRKLVRETLRSARAALSLGAFELRFADAVRVRDTPAPEKR